jgi:hypothetical protein
MNIINCSFSGCAEKIETTEFVSPDAKFLCRYHTGKDTRNKTRFQVHSFDLSLDEVSHPIGVSHIRRKAGDK